MNKLLYGYLGLFVLTTVVTAQNITEDRRPRVVCTFEKTKIVKMVKPTYPPNAAAHGIGGRATVRVLVNEAGEPTEIKFVEGSAFFAQATLEAVNDWRWKPLKPNGKAVPMETTVTANFVPRRKSSTPHRLSGKKSN